MDKIAGFISPITGAIGKIGSVIGAGWDMLFGNAKEEIPVKTAPEIAVKTPRQLRQEKDWAGEYANIKEDWAARQAAEKARQKAEKGSRKKSRRRPQAPVYDDDPDDYASMPVSGGGTGVNVSVAVNVNQTGIPDQTFAEGVVNAIRARQSDFEQIISGIVSQQARLAYG